MVCGEFLDLFCNVLFGGLVYCLYLIGLLGNVCVVGVFSVVELVCGWLLGVEGKWLIGVLGVGLRKGLYWNVLGDVIGMFGENGLVVGDIKWEVCLWRGGVFG